MSALLEALKRVSRLRIEHPDPDRYDDVWNNAIKSALNEIEAVIQQERSAPIRFV